MIKINVLGCIIIEVGKYGNGKPDPLLKNIIKSLISHAQKIGVPVPDNKTIEDIENITTEEEAELLYARLHFAIHIQERK